MTPASTASEPSARTVAGIATGAGVAALFQIGHSSEQALQVAYWLGHPAEAPWITPWAATMRDGLAVLLRTDVAAGTELLHLAGVVARRGQPGGDLVGRPGAGSPPADRVGRNVT